MLSRTTFELLRQSQKPHTYHENSSENFKMKLAFVTNVLFLSSTYIFSVM